MNIQTQVAIIGGGLSGLTAAYQLRKGGKQVQVLELSDRAGGVIRSERVDGFDLDLGPNSLVVNPFLEEWIRELHLEPFQLDAAAVSKNRYLVRDKVLHALSPHPVKLLQSPYLSWTAKGRILTERFRPRGTSPEESVSAFFTRRLGREISEYIADPVFSGIYAGDIDRLSLNEVLPVLAQWEKQFGSLTKGAFKQKGALKGRGRIVNFSGGLQRLTDALAAPLGGALQLNASIKEIQSTGEGYSIGYVQNGVGNVLEASALIYTAPAYTLPGLSWFSDIAAITGTIQYAPIRTVHVAVNSGALQLPEGFGFLVPSREGLSLLGCIFTSAIFPSKAPEGSTLLTLMLGGAHRADDLLQHPDKLQERALEELSQILHIHSGLKVLHGQTWPRAIPQKNVGYGLVQQSLEAFEKTHPHFYFAGNTVSRVSVGDTMQYAAEIASRLL